QSLHAFYQSLSPEPFLSGMQQAQMAGSDLTDAMLSCHPATGGAFRFTDEDECSWLRVTPRMSKISSSAAAMGSKSRSIDFALGHQFRINDNIRIGIAGAYSTTVTRVESAAETFGDSFAGGVALKALADPLNLTIAVTGGQAVNHTNRFLTSTTTATSRQVDGFINMRLRLAGQIWGEDGYYVRPLTELNFSELYAGGFHESGAGPLDLVVPESNQSSGTAGIGFE